MTESLSTRAAPLLEQLFDQGWSVVPNALPESVIAALDADLSRPFAETPFCQGPFYGETTKRFGSTEPKSLRQSLKARVASCQPFFTR